jgi:hypothetical protein
MREDRLNDFVEFFSDAGHVSCSLAAVSRAIFEHQVKNVRHRGIVIESRIVYCGAQALGEVMIPGSVLLTELCDDRREITPLCIPFWANRLNYAVDT